MQTTTVKTAVKRTASAFFCLLVCCALSVLLLYIFEHVVFDTYRILWRNFPEKFPLYNQVSEKAKYLEQTKLFYAIAAYPALFCAAYISVLLNSAKRHLFFNETHGLIGFRDSCRYYRQRFLVFDVLAVILVSAIFLILVSLVPALGRAENNAADTNFIVFMRFFVMPATAIYAKFGAIAACISLPLTIAAGSLSAIPHSVLHYRGDALAHTLE